MDIISGIGTAFLKEAQPGDSLRLPVSDMQNQDVLRVVKTLSDEEVQMERKMQGFEAAGFKVLPKIDQNEIYDTVHERLKQGRCVGIFPEGGSHDRPALLPLKAGVCIMALGAMVKYDIPVAIQCVGLNYFQGHKFRSRVAVNFGTTYVVPQKLGELYRFDKKQAISALLCEIETRMKDVWATAPTYEELSLIFLARRVYRPLHITLSEEQILRLNHLFSKGYAYVREKYGSPPEVEALIGELKMYNSMLESFGIQDSDLRLVHFSSMTFVLYSLISLILVVVSIAAALPGLLVSLPPALYLKFKAERERKKALAGSVVKITGSDVMASIKVTGGMALFPLVTACIASAFIVLNYCNSHSDYDSDLTSAVYKSFLMTVVWPIYFYTCIVFGDTAFKHARRLYLRTKSIFSRTELIALHTQRKIVHQHVKALVEKYGPEIVPNFERERILAAETPKKKMDDAISSAFSILAEVI